MINCDGNLIEKTDLWVDLGNPPPFRWRSKLGSEDFA